MGKGDIKAAKWGLHHCLLSLFKAEGRGFREVSSEGRVYVPDAAPGRTFQY